MKLLQSQNAFAALAQASQPSLLGVLFGMQ